MRTFMGLHIARRYGFVLTPLIVLMGSGCGPGTISSRDSGADVGPDINGEPDDRDIVANDKGAADGGEMIIDAEGSDVVDHAEIIDDEGGNGTDDKGMMIEDGDSGVDDAGMASEDGGSGIDNGEMIGNDRSDTGYEEGDAAPVDTNPCGDGQCISPEDLVNCPEDCSICPDGQCTGPETVYNCPEDCYADQYEVDNSCDAANAILTTGATQRHTFSSSGDEDWVRFPGVAGWVYRIAATSADSSLADPIIMLYLECPARLSSRNLSPVIVDQFDIPGSPLAESTYEWTCYQDGEYHAKFYNSDPQVYGYNTEYSISVLKLDILCPDGQCSGSETVYNCPEDCYADQYEADNSCDAATAILTTGATQTHTFNTLGDEDWVKFSGVTGWVYRITAAGADTSLADPSINLYLDCPVRRSSGNVSPVIVSQFDMSEVLLGGSTLEWTCYQDGEYHAKFLNSDPQVYGYNTEYAISVTRNNAVIKLESHLENSVIEADFLKFVQDINNFFQQREINIEFVVEQISRYDGSAGGCPGEPTSIFDLLVCVGPGEGGYVGPPSYRVGLNTDPPYGFTTIGLQAAVHEFGHFWAVQDFYWLKTFGSITAPLISEIQYDIMNDPYIDGATFTEHSKRIIQMNVNNFRTGGRDALIQVIDRSALGLQVSIPAYPQQSCDVYTRQRDYYYFRSVINSTAELTTTTDASSVFNMDIIGGDSADNNFDLYFIVCGDKKYWINSLVVEDAYTANGPNTMVPVVCNTAGDWCQYQF